MKVHVTLTEAEVAALEAERLSAEESVESVIRRQLQPLLTRLVSNSLDAVLVKFKTLPPIEQFEASKAFERAVKKNDPPPPPPVEEPVDVPVEVKP